MYYACEDSGVAGADASIESMAGDGLRNVKVVDAEKNTCIVTGATNNVRCYSKPVTKKSIDKSEPNVATVVTKVQGLDIAATGSNGAVAGMFFKKRD